VLGGPTGRTGYWLGDSGMLHMMEHQLYHPPDDSSLKALRNLTCCVNTMIDYAIYTFSAELTYRWMCLG